MVLMNLAGYNSLEGGFRICRLDMIKDNLGELRNRCQEDKLKRPSDSHSDKLHKSSWCVTRNCQLVFVYRSIVTIYKYNDEETDPKVESNFSLKLLSNVRDISKI